MDFNDKLIQLRKQANLSQEQLAEKLNVSRQAISRWENSTAMPDATNLLQISKLFNVTTDYLLNNTIDTPSIPSKTLNTNTNLLLFYLISLEIIMLIPQFLSVVYLKNLFFGLLTALPYLVFILSFEYAYRRKPSHRITKSFRKTLYKISAWLGLYFPCRLLVLTLTQIFIPHIPTIAFESIVLAIYIATSLHINLNIDKHYLTKSTD